ncbi:MAG: response regulator [Planctomycetota bacterium]
MSTGYHRTLRLSQRELDAVLKDMNRTQRPQAGPSRRRNRRWTYEGPRAVLTFMDALGNKQHFSAVIRDLSATGAAVMHGGFVYANTPCIVSLRALNGQPHSISCTTASCRLVRGNLHTIGVRFEHPIDPEQFIDGRGEILFNIEHVDPDNLQGLVLHVCPDRDEQKAFAAHFEGTPLDLIFATDAAAAEQNLSEKPHIVFVNSDLGASKGIEFVKAARDGGFDGTILMIAGQATPDERARAKEAGATDLIGTPLEREILRLAVAEYLPEPEPAQEEDQASEDESEAKAA